MGGNLEIKKKKQNKKTIKRQLKELDINNPTIFL